VKCKNGADNTKEKSALANTAVLCQIGRKSKAEEITSTAAKEHSLSHN
jgi:hypothetical protein